MWAAIIKIHLYIESSNYGFSFGSSEEVCGAIRPGFPHFLTVKFMCHFMFWRSVFVCPILS